MKSSWQQLDDATAITDIRRGGQEGIKFIFYRYGKRLQYFLQKSLPLSPADVDDVLQIALLKFVRGIKHYDDQKSCIYTYLAKICVNAGRDFLKEKRRQSEKNLSYPNDFPDEDTQDILSDENLEKKLCYQLCVANTLEKFAKDFPKCYAVLTWQEQNQYIDIRTIAMKIGRTERATTVFLSECRKKFRCYLQPCRDDCSQL